jgi:Holliday junction resolvasome RuvABC endonuclease subunit
MNVLGLDLSLASTGVCVVEDDALVKVQLVTTPASWATGKRLAFIVGHIGRLWGGVDELGIEDTFFKPQYSRKNFDSYKHITRLGGAIQANWYEFTGKEAQFLMASHARSVCGIDAHASKAEVQLDVGCWLGLIDQDEANAIAGAIQQAKSYKAASRRKSELDKIARRIPREHGKILTNDVADAIVVACAILAKNDRELLIGDDLEVQTERGANGRQ